MEENAKILAVSITMLQVPSIAWGAWALLKSDKKPRKLKDIEIEKITQLKNTLISNLGKKDNAQKSLDSIKNNLEKTRIQGKRIHEKISKIKNQDRLKEARLEEQAIASKLQLLNTQIKTKQKEVEKWDKISSDTKRSLSSRLPNDEQQIIDANIGFIKRMGKIPGGVIALWLIIFCVLLINYAYSSRTPSAISKNFNRLGWIHLLVMTMTFVWLVSYSVVNKNSIIFYSLPFFVSQLAISMLLIKQKFHKC